MQRDEERVERIGAALAEERLDALIVAQPEHVLLFTGYWPVVGTSIAVASRDGRIALIAPEDERDYAERGWADERRYFAPGALDELQTPREAVREPLQATLNGLSFDGARLGYESGAFVAPASYAAVHFYAGDMKHMLRAAAPRAQNVPAMPVLDRLKSVLTSGELARLRAACRIAEAAFWDGAGLIGPGQTELTAAERFRALFTANWGEPVERADAHVWCMSGSHSAQAFGAYARSSHRALRAGDTVLVHCNSYADGFWTDITRTFCLGEPDPRQQRIYDAVFEARAAALGAIRPGARAADVDRAAREVLAAGSAPGLGGFGQHFKHPTGHGCGFVAINRDALPRLHPRSPDRLETGMVCNVGPGLYFHEYLGVRHCDMVVVGLHGAEVLTPFHQQAQDLVLVPTAA